MRTNATTRILFGAADGVWPDASLAPLFPRIPGVCDRIFLNLGLIIGYADEFLAMLGTNLYTTTSDQLFYTCKYLDKTTRDTLKIRLDAQLEILVNVVGLRNINIVTKKSATKTDTDVVVVVVVESYGAAAISAAVFHGNGVLGREILNTIENYVNVSCNSAVPAKNYKPNANLISAASQTARILLAVFVVEPTSTQRIEQILAFKR